MNPPVIIEQLEKSCEICLKKKKSILNEYCTDISNEEKAIKIKTIKNILNDNM